jgi:hypothetical protein
MAALWGLLTALPRLWAVRRRRARALSHASLPVSGLTAVESREADYALTLTASSEEVRGWQRLLSTLSHASRLLGAQDKALLLLRHHLLDAAQAVAAALCAELRAAERDAAFWRSRAATARLASAASRLLARARAALPLHPPHPAQPLLLCAPCDDEGEQARLAALREPVRTMLAALARIHQAAWLLGPPLLRDCERAGSAPAAEAVSAAVDGVYSALRSLHGTPPESLPVTLAHVRQLAHFPLGDEAGGYPLGVVPLRSRRPPAWRRALPSLALRAAAALLAARWLAQRARSGELAAWARQSRSALVGAYQEHIAQPLKAVSAELFATFRARPGVVSQSTLDASRASLDRQLAAFAAAHGRVASADVTAVADAEADMDVLMRTYEREVPRPLRGFLSGDLAWALLIQAQKIKTDGEAAMRALDQVLRANELTIAVVAALPSLGLLALLGAALRRLLAATPVPPGAATESLRRWFAEAERALSECEEAQEGEDADAAFGRALLALDAVHAAAAQLLHPFGAPPARTRALEWAAFQMDLLAVASPSATPERRLRAAERMVRAHTALQVSR